MSITQTAQIDTSSDGPTSQKSTGNAAHVLDQLNGGGSNYVEDKTVDSAASTREAIPAGAKAVWVRNNGATNFMRFVFGDSTITATLTIGFRLNVNEAKAVVIPVEATHWAYIADTADVTASVVWS